MSMKLFSQAQMQSKGASPHGHGAQSPRQYDENSVSAGSYTSGHRPGMPEQERYGAVTDANPWEYPDAAGAGQAVPPAPPYRNIDNTAPNSDYHQRYNSIGRKDLSGTEPRDPYDGVEGGAVPLTALPLPPGRHSSGRATASQRRVLERLKQNQMRSQEQPAKKIMNYATATTHHPF